MKSYNEAVAWIAAKYPCGAEVLSGLATSVAMVAAIYGREIATVSRDVIRQRLVDANARKAG